MLVQARSSHLNSLPILLHLLAIIYLIYTSTGEASLVALTFLALNDLLASFIQLASQMMTAFDVWQIGTLQLPFGLQRMETLAHFGLGAFSTFNGLYVLKETIEDIIIGFSEKKVLLEGTSGGHHHHHHYTQANPHRYILSFHY
jgi:divalent metal cation (Fe/Co/Zn/Cd) transporter